MLPTAVRALRAVTRRADGGSHAGSGVPHIYLTNGGGVTEAAKAAQLSALFGLRIPAEAVVLSHSPMRQLLPEFADQLVLTLGKTDVRSVARSYGFRHLLIPEDLSAKYPALIPHHPRGGLAPLLDPAVTQYRDELSSIALIVCMHDPVDWYRDLQLCLDVLTAPQRQGRPPALYFSNPDFVFSGAHAQPRLAQGAFRVCLEALYKQSTGRELPHTLWGKPNAVTYRYAEGLLQAQAAAAGQRISRIYGIGDNPAADIRGANAAGPQWRSVFVRTGTIARSDDPAEQPHFDVACVEEAVNMILKEQQEQQA